MLVWSSLVPSPTLGRWVWLPVGLGMRLGLEVQVGDDSCSRDIAAFLACCLRSINIAICVYASVILLLVH